MKIHILRNYLLEFVILDHLKKYFREMIRKDILKDSGTISHKEALKKAHEEYDKYMQKHLTTAEKDYLEMLNKKTEEINR